MSIQKLGSPHEMVERQVWSGRLNALIHRAWMEADELSVGDVLPSIASAREDLGKEAPGNDRTNDNIVVLVAVIRFRNLDKVSLSSVSSTTMESEWQEA